MSPVRALLVASPLVLLACNGKDTDDTEAPDAPVLTETDPASPSRNNEPDVLGTAEAGSSVVIYADADCSQSLGRSTTNDQGGFRVAIEVESNTENMLYATASDAAGNMSDCTDTPLVYIEDSAPPQTLEVTSITPEGPSTATEVTLVGTTEAGALVRLYDTDDCDDDELAEVDADDTGAFSITVTVLNDRTTTFYLTARDDAFNATECTAGPSFVQDATAPTRPVISRTDPTSPAHDSTPTLYGTAEDNAAIHVYSDNTCTTEVGTTTADDTGAWSLELTVAENSDTTFYATATDGVGHVSTCSLGVQYVDDSTAPAGPDFTHTSPNSPSPYGEPLIHGWAEEWATVRLYEDDTCSGTQAASGLADTSGNFALRVQHSNGESVTYYGTATDRAGNLSPCTGSITYEDSGSVADLDIVYVTPQGDPKRVSIESSIALEAIAAVPSGLTASWLWEIVDGDGALENETAAKVTFTAGSSAGLVTLQVTASDNTNSVVWPVYVQVEEDEAWFTLQEGLSNARAGRIDLERSVRGMPFVLDTYDAEFDLWTLPLDYVGVDRVLGYTNADADYDDVDMAIDYLGRPWVISADGETDTPTREVSVKRLDGDTWTTLGDLSAYASYSVAITFDDQEQAWIALESSDTVVVMTWDGADWQQVGTAIVDDDTTLGVGTLSLAVRGEQAVVGYRHATSSFEGNASAFLLDQGDWVEAGNLESSLYELSDIEIAANGTILASYSDGSPNLYQPVVARYIPSNDNWTKIGSIPVGSTAVNDDMHMALDRSDGIYVVVNNKVLYTSDWATWSVVGDDAFGTQYTSSKYADIVVRDVQGNHVVYVAYPSNETPYLTSIAAYVLR